MIQTVASHPPFSQSASAALDVELRQVVKLFEGEPAVGGIDLQIQQGEFFSILGPSGCGKTTTLRMIAGFESLSRGELWVAGKNMHRVPAHRRSVNTVFQNYALFNHMSVWDNVAFGLRVQRCRRAELRERVGEALQLVQMEAFTQRYPQQLSGGQKQRVALARALVNRPAVMLLDEPLGALDLKLRKQMQVELSNLHKRLGITFVMVTHDQEEALSLSDRIAVMNNGQIEQIGTPNEIYEAPATAFVADFIGETNLLSGQWSCLPPEPPESETPELSPRKGLGQFETDHGTRFWVKVLNGAHEPRAVEVSIRPEKIQLSHQVQPGLDNSFEGRIKHMMYLGTHVFCVVELLTGDRLTVRLPNHTEHRADPHCPVWTSWLAADCQTFLA